MAAIETCRCGWDGTGPHLCHSGCGRTGRLRFYSRGPAVLSGVQLKFSADDTYACDECWHAFRKDAEFLAGIKAEGPKTLGQYRQLCVILGGPGCRAVQFLDKTIAETSADEKVIQHESQMLALLGPMLTQPAQETP